MQTFDELNQLYSNWRNRNRARLQDHPAKRIAELLPWNWKRARQQKAAA